MKWNFGLPPENIKLLCKIKAPYHEKEFIIIGSRKEEIVDVSLTLRYPVNHMICWESLEIIDKELETKTLLAQVSK